MQQCFMDPRRRGRRYQDGWLMLCARVLDFARRFGLGVFGKSIKKMAEAGGPNRHTKHVDDCEKKVRTWCILWTTTESFGWNRWAEAMPELATTHGSFGSDVGSTRLPGLQCRDDAIDCRSHGNAVIIDLEAVTRSRVRGHGPGCSGCLRNGRGASLRNVVTWPRLYAAHLFCTDDMAARRRHGSEIAQMYHV